MMKGWIRGFLMGGLKVGLMIGLKVGLMGGLMVLLMAAGCESTIEPDKKAEDQFGVMSFNLRLDTAVDGINRWEMRKEFAADVILNSGASLIGTQEGLVHQLDYLDDALPSFMYVGVGRDDGGTAGEFAAIFIDTTRFSVIDSGTFWLSETPDRPSVGWDAALERVATYAIVRDRVQANSTPMLIMNAHFDHMGEQARLESARLMVEKAVEKALELQNDEKRAWAMPSNPPAPVILTGDFNTPPRSAPVEVFLQQYKDTFEASASPPIGPVSTFNGFAVVENGYMDAVRRIDYVFVNHRVDVIQYETIDEVRNGKYVSDHFPVLVQLGLKEGADQ